MKAVGLLGVLALGMALLVGTLGPLSSPARADPREGIVLAQQTCPQLSPANYTLYPNPDGSPGWNNASYCGRTLAVPQALNNVEPNVDFVFQFLGGTVGWRWWIKGSLGNTISELTAGMILWVYFAGAPGTVWIQPAP